MAITPYVVGQWVRGNRFYGRKQQLKEILYGNRNSMWLLGTRRIGKTSLLKQLEYLTNTSPEMGYFPFFWDFQGAAEPADLTESFCDSLYDFSDRFTELGIPVDSIESDDLFASISRLRRELRKKDLTLLLLGDEVEELVEINAREPKFLRRLRRALQSAENIRTVLASKIKLWDLAYQETSTSPFLHGFTPPLYVHGLTDEAARDLIRQAQLPEESRPPVDDETVENIRKHCHNHPYLLQILGERYMELRDIDQAIEEVATDQMVSHFFAVDFAMLTDAERDVIRAVNARQQATSREIHQETGLPDPQLTASLNRLKHLGFIYLAAETGYSLANYFFERWYADIPPSLEPSDGSDPTQTIRLVGGGEGETGITHLANKRYELRDQLGEGATGKVYAAYDTMLQTTVAVKVLKREHTGYAESLERLRREVVLCRNLSHANILKIYNLSDDNGVKFIIMQYIDGQDLAKLLEKEAPLPLEILLTLAMKIASALKAAHAEGILHRDIKPSNILIDRDGEPVVTDFGLARLRDGPEITRRGTFLGTPAYASPEQVQGQALDERSDIYSLGVLLFEMATGRRPFSGEGVLMDHVGKVPPDPVTMRPDLPRALADTILRCLEKAPANRFQSACDLLINLRDFAQAMRR